MSTKHSIQCEEAFAIEFDDDGAVPVSSYKHWPAFEAGWSRAIAFMEQRAPEEMGSASLQPTTPQGMPVCAHFAAYGLCVWGIGRKCGWNACSFDPRKPAPVA